MAAKLSVGELMSFAKAVKVIEEALPPIIECFDDGSWKRQLKLAVLNVEVVRDRLLEAEVTVKG